MFAQTFDLCANIGFYNDVTKKMTQNMLFCAEKSFLPYGLIVSFSENLASDSNQGTSFLDGQRIIVGHAHRYFLE